MTSPSRRDVERKIDDLEKSSDDPDPPDYVLLSELKEGTCPPGTPTIADMLSGIAETNLLVDVRDEADASDPEPTDASGAGSGEGDDSGEDENEDGDRGRP